MVAISKIIIIIALMQCFLLATDKPLNYGLRLKEHSVTNILFNRLGFPIFESEFNCRLPFHLIKASENKQFIYCTNKLREAIRTSPTLKRNFSQEQLKNINAKKPRIDKLTWHHHQAKSKQLLQLVNRELHDKTAHSGGRSIFGGGKLGRLGKLELQLQSNIIYKNKNITSINDYNQIAKSIDKRAIAVPAIITKDNRLIISIKSGLLTGISIIMLESSDAYYAYIKGDIYSAEFEQKVIDSIIKSGSVAGVESLVMFLIPSPQGLIILGAGVGVYIMVNKVLDSYKYYKEKHFLNKFDLKVYGIELDSVLDINDNNIPLNISNW